MASPFSLFNLLPLPIAVIAIEQETLIFSNDAFNTLFSVNAATPDSNKIQNIAVLFKSELAKLKENEHIFSYEFNHHRAKKIYQFTLKIDEETQYCIMSGQDISQLRKTEYLLSSSSKMLEKHSKRMHDLAHTDQLTNIPNRRAIFAKFQQWKVTKAHFKCAISILDIDHFKKFNDTYGHEFGDAVLKIFCQHIMSMLPVTSYFARLGGEEFCLLQDKTADPSSSNEVSNILQSVKELQLKAPCKTMINISFSAGVAEYGKDGTTLDALLNNADEALYYAKHHGRACVIPFSTELYKKRDTPSTQKHSARTTQRTF